MEVYHRDKLLDIVFFVFLVEGITSSSVICPDGSKCLVGATCCWTGNYFACCLYPNAVCCPDLLHCCPQSFQCMEEHGGCKRPGLGERMPMLTSTAGEKPGIRLPLEPEPQVLPVPGVLAGSIVHRDSYYNCPDGTTSCRHPSGLFSCCPYSLEDACCLSTQGCCPSGFRCNELKSCVVDTEQRPMTALQGASNSQPHAAVILCDIYFFCPSGNTCCKNPATGEWGCCPYPLGQCCADGVHCCEYRSVCDTTSTSCSKKYPSGTFSNFKFQRN